MAGANGYACQIDPLTAPGAANAHDARQDARGPGGRHRRGWSAIVPRPVRFRGPGSGNRCRGDGAYRLGDGISSAAAAYVHFGIGAVRGRACRPGPRASPRSSCCEKGPSARRRDSKSTCLRPIIAARKSRRVCIAELEHAVGIGGICAQPDPVNQVRRAKQLIGRAGRRLLQRQAHSSPAQAWSRPKAAFPARTPCFPPSARARNSSPTSRWAGRD